MPTATKKASVDDNANTIYEYLYKQNRPYSVLDIHANLHGEIQKAGIVKALAALVQEDRVVEKEYGKAKIYFINQNAMDNPSKEDIDALDAHISGLERENKTVAAETQDIERDIGALKTRPTLDNLKQRKASRIAEIAALRAKITSITEGGTTMTHEKRDQIVKQFEISLKEWKKRKRKFTDMANAVLESYPGKKSKFYEEIDCETDEQIGLKPSDFEQFK
eukprot:Clim_evm65s149 gene=Clim_evmTU65s149